MINERKAGVILSYSSMAVSIISGIIYVPFLLSTIGQEEYGLYQLLGGMISYASLFDFGLSNTVTRFYIKYKQLGDRKNMENVLSLSRMIFWGLTLICLGVFLIIYFNLQKVFPKLPDTQIEEGKIIFLLLMVSISSSIPTYVYQAISNAEERFIFLRGLSLLVGILQPICVILLVLQHPSAITVVAVQATLNVILAIIKIAYVKLNLRVKFKFHGWDKGLIKSLFSFSVFVFINTIVDQVNWEIGKTMVGIIQGDTAAVTVLSLGLQLGKYYMMFSSNINSVFFSTIQRSIIADPTMKSASDIFIKVGRIQALILGLILTGFVIFGQEFINIWGGSENAGAYFIALALMIVLFIPLTQNIGIGILEAKNIHSYRSLIYLILSVVNIGISIPCIMKLGEYGAAIGMVVSFFVGNNILVNILYKKKTNIDLATYFKFTVKFVLILAILSVPLYFINRLIIVDGYLDGYLLLFAKIIAFTLIYAMVVWLLVMNKYEKNLILSVFRKIFSALKIKKKQPAMQPAALEQNNNTIQPLSTPAASLKVNENDFAHIEVSDKGKCCGCEACVNICPVHCIIMVEDGEGFRYPHVDKEKCINCGACKRTCIYCSPIEPKPVINDCYACYNSDEATRLSSSSGGIFTLLVSTIISNGGIVYGVAYDKENGAIYKRAETMEECTAFQGSKYVQALNNDCYSQVKQDLLAGKTVLYSGTSCQVNALHKFLGNIDSSRLYCVDVICHGVPGTLMYRKYIEYLETRYMHKVANISFRNKSRSWQNYDVCIIFDNDKTVNVPATKDCYLKAFLSDVLLRPACMQCISKGDKTYSDITIGDYWGCDREHATMNDDKGLSALIIRSEKGAALFDNIKDNLCLESASLDDITLGNPALVQPPKQKYNRKKFLEEIRVRDFNLAVIVFFRKPLSLRIRNLMVRIFRRIFR